MIKNNSSENYPFIFTGIILKKYSGYSGLCADINISSEGNTIEETKKNLEEAASLYIKSAIKNDLPIARPVMQNENPQFTSPDIIQEVYDMKIGFEVNISPDDLF